ncbi:uncharacterized protein VP01_1931g7, partial [Puccinia sorghi]
MGQFRMTIGTVAAMLVVNSIKMNKSTRLEHSGSISSLASVGLSPHTSGSTKSPTLLAGGDTVESTQLGQANLRLCRHRPAQHQPGSRFNVPVGTRGNITELHVLLEAMLVEAHERAVGPTHGAGVWSLYRRGGNCGSQQ